MNSPIGEERQALNSLTTVQNPSVEFDSDKESRSSKEDGQLNTIKVTIE